MKSYLSKSNFWSLSPHESLKRGYGLIKRHKAQHPLRPIVSSCNSITEGAEKFIARLISPIVDKCSFSVKSNKEFKDLFLKNLKISPKTLNLFLTMQRSYILI